MSLATLDTHEVVKDLQSAGFSDAQAEAVARNLRKAQDLDFSSLATKIDLEHVRFALSTDIEKVRTDLSKDIEAVRTDLSKEIEAVRADLSKEIEKLRTEIADTKAEIVKWVFGAIGFQTLVIVGAVLALMKFLKP